MENQGRPEENNVVWPQPDLGQYVPLTSASITTPAPAPSHETPAPLQPYHQPQYEAAAPAPYQPPYSASYQMNGAQAEMYQAAHSTYERISPVAAEDDYHNVASGSESMASYQQLPVVDSGQLIAAPVVDSSSLQHSGYHVHQVVLDSEHRVVAVQRVVAPADCTVSQSSLSLPQESSEVAPNNARLLPVSSSGQAYVTVQVTSMPSFSSQNEVSTSSGSPLMQDEAPPDAHLGDREADHHVSSIHGTQVTSLSGALHEPLMSHPVPKAPGKMESIRHEPDTTQQDVHDFMDHNAAHRAYLHHSASSLPDNSGLSSEALHSTVTVPISMTPMASTSSRGDVMDPTMDSSQLSSTQDEDSSLGATRDTNLDSTMERAVDSSALSMDMDSMVTGSDASMVQTFDSQDENKENHPQTSGFRLRKSSRIAYLDQEASTSWQRRRTYIPRPYNPDENWCEECMTSYAIECPTHRLNIILDKVVLSRAWASLPSVLQIFRLQENTGEGERETAPLSELGVFAKRPLPKFTQFGPFVGELVDSEDKVRNRHFKILLDQPDNTVGYFDTSDENKCNWMMFVRPAQTFAEQNLVAYQHALDIYFTATKNIEAKQELKVWYAPPYAARMGVPLLEITDQDIEAIEDMESKFPCYECNKRFRTSMLLQKHLLVHEEGATSKTNDIDFTAEQKEAKKMKRNTPVKSNIFRSRGRPGQKDFSESYTYNWKKKSTSIYLNKTLKKYQRRPCTEKIRQTIKSLYKKKGKETGGNEWVCTHCDLTFDNSSLLNLHTLTHAAEDVGLDEIRKFACDFTQPEQVEMPVQEGQSNTSDGERLVSLETYLVCPMCRVQFDNKRDLIEHAAEHGKVKKKPLNLLRPHKCDRCWKAFTTQERLQKHMLCHEEDAKPLQCQVCHKRFMNNSALACHMKTHSDKKYYDCPICHLGFDNINAMKDHVVQHSDNGVYTCPECQKVFEEFHMIRKHMKAFHTDKKFPCPECDKVFPRPDKLKLHMLRHSSHREFMCETCGRQFKRKDKLKEHIKRMHSAEREARLISRVQNAKKFVPKVSPTDYHRFIYKCHECLLGFKRRGMLVNHLAKRHPDIKPETVPELNLPILKTQRDYYCQYCDKVYKSSSKRKSHIMKNHPGAELPLSSRKRSLISEIPGMPNPTYSQTVGSITTMPHSCDFCHKQYASKAKLMQHQRRKHPDLVPAAPERRKKDASLNGLENAHAQVVTERYEEVATVPVSVAQPDSLQAADLLTQAMSELTQTLQEYRPTGGEYIQRITQAGVPTMVHVQAPGQMQHTTIELSHLGQALTQLNAQPVTLTTAISGAAVIAAPTSSTQQPANQPVAVSIVTTTPSQTIPVTIATQGFVPRSWTNFQSFPSR